MEENGQLVQFLYSGREVVAETESVGNVIRYIRGLGLISSDSESAKTYYHYVTDEYSSVTHLVEGEEKAVDRATAEITALARDKKQSRILNHYTYDAFGNTISCEEEVHNRFRYNGEQYDPVSQQYYLRARYYNPVISRFTQEDTYYGDGLNLYRYCANNPVRYKDPSGHGSVEQNPYNRHLDEGAHPEAVDLAGQLYPDQASKQSIIDEYIARGYSETDAMELADRELIFGREKAIEYGEQHMKKVQPDTTQSNNVNAGGSKSTYPQVDLNNLPQNVQDSFHKYDKAGWKGNVSGQAPGTNAGRKWRNSKAQLPQYDAAGNPITYREFDVNDYNGVQRDSERFIVGDDGSVWYSDSHYGEGISLNGIADFVQIR